MASLSLGEDGRPVPLCLHGLFRSESSPPAYAPPPLYWPTPLPLCLLHPLPPCSLFPKPISCYHPLPFRTKHKARSPFFVPFICVAKAEMGWENMGRSSFPSLTAAVCSEHSWLLGTVGWVSVASPVSLGAPSFMWGLWPLRCPVVSFGKGSPTWWYHLFLVSPESQGPSRWASLSGKSHWYVRCPMEQLCSGKIRVQSSESAEVSGEPDQMGSVQWTCLQGGLGLGEAWLCSTSGGWEGVEVGLRGVGTPVWR